MFRDFVPFTMHLYLIACSFGKGFRFSFRLFAPFDVPPFTRTAHTHSEHSIYKRDGFLIALSWDSKFYEILAKISHTNTVCRNGDGVKRWGGGFFLSLCKGKVNPRYPSQRSFPSLWLCKFFASLYMGEIPHWMDDFAKASHSGRWCRDLRTLLNLVKVISFPQP